MKIWRVHIKPDSKKGVDPFELCLREGVVGVGWRISSRPVSKDDYMKIGQKEYGGRGWKTAANAILYRMQEKKDLVWSRNQHGVYYIGRITGDWEYRNTKEYVDADILNVRACEWHEVGTSVCGKIINCFRPSRAIQQIRDSSAELFSKIVLQQESGESVPIDVTDKIDIFSLLSAEDLEDLAGIYLQANYDYVIIPSSRSLRDDTPYYEYELISKRDGHRAYVQVKSGNIRLNPAAYDDFGRKMYLFSPAGYGGSGTQNTHTLDVDAVRTFLHENKHIMPYTIQRWLDFEEYIEARQGSGA